VTYWNVDAVRIAKVRGLPLSEAVQHWDRSLDAAIREAADQQRRRVLDLFPIDAWPSLSMVRYGLGNEVDEFF
jgi:hypothetical protein